MKQNLFSSLDSRGALHILLPLIVMVMVAATGAYILKSSSSAVIADPPATTNFHYYSQDDSRWANEQYPYRKGSSGEGVISLTGCGPTSMAMVSATLANSGDTPLDLARKYGNKYHYSSGTSIHVYGKFAKDHGLKKTDLSNLKQAKKFLGGNRLVIANVETGIFTGSGHIIVLRAFQNDQFLVADPKHPENNRWFSFSDIKDRGNVKKLTGFAR